MGPEKPGIFVCPDKIKDLSLSHAFPQGMLFYSPKNFKAMMKNNETFTYKGHSYLIPTHNDENANIRFTGFKLKFNGQTLTPGDGEEPYFTITDTNADQSFSLFMEETDCDDMSAVYIVPFYIYREDESQPFAGLRGDVGLVIPSFDLVLKVLLLGFQSGFLTFETVEVGYRQRIRIERGNQLDGAQRNNEQGDEERDRPGAAATGLRRGLAWSAGAGRSGHRHENTRRIRLSGCGGREAMSSLQA